METKALLVLDTWSNSIEFKTDLINTMKSNGLNIITDLEATDIVLALNYMTSLIYSYYKNYYLSNASKERTLELMSITTSGKLNFYASELKAYKDAYAHDFKSLGGNENSSTHNTTLNRSGKSKQATTPETIAKGTDYIDDYSSSEQKYENANTEKGTRSYNSTIKGSEQDYWKNIISIPKRLFEDIIGSFSKFFFSSSMELTPCAVLTIEQALQKLKDEIKALDTTTSTEINSLKSLIKINQEEIKDLKTSVDTLVTAGENTDNRVSTLEKQTGDIQRKIDKTNTNLENLTKVTPTDVGVKDKKLGLKHDTTWLTNQDAITLGDNLTYDETTKTLNAKGGGNVSPTLSLVDIDNNALRTSITEQEKQNLEKGLYNQVLYANMQDGNLLDIYSPSKLVVGPAGIAFTNFDEPTGNEKMSFKSMSLFDISIGDKNATNEYPITIKKEYSFNIGGDSSSIPILATTFNADDYATITLTDEDIATIKAQENNLLSVNVEYVGLSTGANIFGVSSIGEDTYLLTFISGYLGNIVLLKGGAPALMAFAVNTSTKHITQFVESLSLMTTSTLFVSKNNEIYFSGGVQEEGQDPEPLNKKYNFDKINGNPIIHTTETEVKNYIIGDYTAFQEDDHTDYVKILLKKNNVEEYYGGYVPKSLNATATPKVLRSVNNTMSWVELPKYYEHDGILKVNSNYIMFKYISNDSAAQTDFNKLVNDFSGNYITASGSFVLGTDQIAMVYGIDFDTLMLSCNVLDLSTHNLISDDIAFNDLTIETYSENVR